MNLLPWLDDEWWNGGFLLRMCENTGICILYKEISNKVLLDDTHEY